MVRYVRSDRVHGHDRGRTDNTTPVVTNVTTVELERRQGHSHRVHRAFEREFEPDRNVGYSRRVQCIKRDEVHPEYRGTSGTSPSASASAKSYRLDADDSQLTPHVGHKVEITGTVQGGASASSATSTGSTTNAPKLKVDSVKMIASSCQ